MAPSTYYLSGFILKFDTNQRYLGYEVGTPVEWLVYLHRFDASHCPQQWKQCKALTEFYRQFDTCLYEGNRAKVIHTFTKNSGALVELHRSVSPRKWSPIPTNVRVTSVYGQRSVLVSSCVTRASTAYSPVSYRDSGRGTTRDIRAMAKLRVGLDPKDWLSNQFPSLPTDTYPCNEDEQKFYKLVPQSHVIAEEGALVK